MTDAIACPACGHALELPSSYRGHLVQCAACAQTFTAPGSASAAQPGDLAEDAPEYFPRPLPLARGGLMLALAVVSLLLPCTGLVLAPVLWVMAGEDLRHIRAGSLDPSGTGLIRLARWLSLASLGWVVAAAILWLAN